MITQSIKYAFAFAIILGGLNRGDCAFTHTLVSPEGTVAVTVAQDSAGNPSAGETDLRFMATCGTDTAIEWSPLGLRMTEPALSGTFQFVSQSDTSIDETYTMVSGKASRQRNRCNQLTLTFTAAGGVQVDCVVRAYDDGMAYRYRLHGARRAAAISEELSGFSMPQGSRMWIQETQSGDMTYEETFDAYTLGDSIPVDRYGNFPALFHTPGGSWVLLTEAAVDGTYGACHYTISEDRRSLFRIALPQAVIAGGLPWETPWRVAVIGRSQGTIVESNLVEQLNPPCAISDVGWIRPGRAAWSWWSDNTSPSSLAAQKNFVDFAHEAGWEYVLVDEGWSRAWIGELVQYGAQKNVGVLVWYNWADLDAPDERASTLAWCAAAGVKGVKVDFINSDGQDRMRFYDALVREAAQNRLVVNFHGSTLYRGQRRSWPNLLTMEAVRGAEHYLFEDQERGWPSPGQNCILPFTRNAVGPMDYTPVAFSAVTRATTAAHELALAVVFESGLQHFADAPDVYAASPGYPLLRRVPAAWDNTRFAAGAPGEYACIARRKGDAWYVAGINAGGARDAAFELPYVKQGTYTADIYADDGQGGIAVSKAMINTQGVVSVSMAANGGFCFVLDGAYDPARDTLAVRFPAAQGETVRRRAVAVCREAGAYRVTVAIPGDYCVRIIDVRGRCLAHKMARGRETERIDAGRLSAGVRLVCVTGGAVRYAQRIVDR